MSKVLLPKRWQHGLFALLASAMLSCQQPTPEPSEAVSEAANAPAAVRLTLLVVDDHAIAEAVRLLRGEWSERSGGELVVAEMSLEELLATKKIDADLIIFPSRQVGALVSRRWLRPVRNALLESREYEQHDLFPIIREHTMRFGTEVIGLSLGDAPLMLRSDTSAETTRQTTWNELHLSQGTALREFLARGISNHAPGKRTEAMFDAATFECRLNTRPFLRALTEMTPKQSTSPNDASTTQPRLSWPGDPKTSSSKNEPQVHRFSSLPTRREVFDPVLETWVANDRDKPMAIFGFAGRMLSVTTASRNAASAFKLAGWLSSGTNAETLSKQSRATLWFRRSQVARARSWMPNHMTDDASIGNINHILTDGDLFLLPRIPGIDEYLDTLSQNIHRALTGDLSVEETLAKTTQQFESITDRRGRDLQIVAYRRHLGLGDLANDLAD